jgi:hypothetical protein
VRRNKGHRLAAKISAGIMMKFAKAIALAITIPAICMAGTVVVWRASALPLSDDLLDWLRGYGLFFVQSGWLGAVYLIST